MKVINLFPYETQVLSSIKTNLLGEWKIGIIYIMPNFKIALHSGEQLNLKSGETQ